MNPDSNPTPEASHWLYSHEGTSVGPCSFDELQALAKAGTITPETLVTKEGVEDWQPLSAHLTSADSPAEVTPPPPSTAATIGGCAVLIGLVLLVVWCGMFLKSCIFGDGTSPPTHSHSSSQGSKRGNESTISWQEIDQIYNLESTYTEVQKDEKWKRFEGKRVRWSGTITEVSKGFLSGTTLSIKMNPNTFTSDLIIELTSSGAARAAKFRKGTRIGFTGKLDRWGSLLPITLTDGEIVD